MKEGICKLTGEPGKFVKAHIIPKALTLHASAGKPIVQAGERQRPVKRWDSWYDPQLVTRAGEDILADYDTWAVNELRKHRLIWSSWGPMKSLSVNDSERIADSPYGIRRITGVDTLKLRLFYLSLLWRAAASNRPEFRNVNVKPADLRRLRRMVRDGDPYPLGFYSVSLTQLSTIGPAHNHGPMKDRKATKPWVEHGGPRVPILRFYFDGLVAHMQRSIKEVEALGPLVLGVEPSRVVLSTVTFEASWQRSNLRNVTADAYHEWPDDMARLYGGFDG